MVNSPGSIHRLLAALAAAYCAWGIFGLPDARGNYAAGLVFFSLCCLVPISRNEKP